VFHIKAVVLAEEVGACGIHGGVRARAGRTLGHFIEHVAGDCLGMVGAVFGLAMGRFMT